MKPVKRKGGKAMTEKPTQISERMLHAINGPTRPNMPKTSPFLVEDAEAEIRRSVQRHFAMQAEIEELKTDRDHWRNEAQLFKAENERLQQRLKDTEEYNDELKHSMATLEAHMHNSAQSFVSAFNALREVKHVKVVAVPALEQITARAHDDADDSAV
jgi:chromosome segregation ATPase